MVQTAQFDRIVINRRGLVNQVHIWYPALLASILYGIYVISTNFNSPEVFSWIVLTKTILQYYCYLYIVKWVDRRIDAKEWRNQYLKLLSVFILGWIISLIVGLVLYVILKQSLIIINNQNDSIGFYHILITILSITVGYVLIFSMFLVTKSQRQQLDSELKNVAFEREQLRLKYELLYNKLEPHFLFNNLNTLHSLIVANESSAEGFVMSLSKVMRHSFQSHEKESVPVLEEVEILRHYIKMLKERVGESLTFEEIIDVKEQRHLIPMTLTHLLENIVKHNEISTEKPMHISLKVSQGGVELRNTLNRKGRVKESSNGSLNTLEEMYRIKAGIELKSREVNGEFDVKIPFLSK